MPESIRTSTDAVSEVVGQILMFGILSVVLTMSLLSFNIAKETAEERIIYTSATAVAEQVKAVVGPVALMAAALTDQDIEVESLLDLPQKLESRSYTVQLAQDSVTVQVGSTGAVAQASLFSTHDPGNVHICAQSAIRGDAMYVRLVNDTTYTANVADIDCDAATGSSTFYLYLSST